MKADALAAQLRCPSGTEASRVAKQLNKSNGSINRTCIERLRIKAFDSLLEIGPGNGTFVADIVNRASNVSYIGLDWSADMVAEANRLNERLVRQGAVQFRHGSSDHLPFQANRFDTVLTVHTLYFWEKPGEHLAEIKRVLKPNGLFCIAFGDASFMEDLSFVRYGFELYDMDDACALLRSSGFRVRATEQYHENERSDTDEIYKKIINVVECEA